jgi:prolipoprotein diacylglyceryltransferase
MQVIGGFFAGILFGVIGAVLGHVTYSGENYYFESLACAIMWGGIGYMIGVPIGVYILGKRLKRKGSLSGSIFGTTLIVVLCGINPCSELPLDTLAVVLLPVFSSLGYGWID